MEVTHHTPEIFTPADFWSPGWCAELIEASEDRGFYRAPVNTGRGEVQRPDIRNNDRVNFMDYSLADDIWKALKPYFAPEHGLYTAIGLNEMFRVYRYEPGQRFARHRDGSYERNAEELSFWTFMIYLNDDCQGGETSFRKFSIKPKTGTALCFVHQVMHEGTTVTEGTKYVLRSDVMFRKTEMAEESDV